MTTTSADIPPPGIADEIRAIARLSFPIALAQAGMMVLGLVDVAIVGRLSVEDLAATSMGRSLFYAFGALGIGIAYAIDPIASQALGAGRPARADAALGVALRAGVVTSVAGTAAAFAATALLEPLGVDAALVPRVRGYMLGHAPGMYLFFAFLAGKSLLQARGETRPALVAALAANVVNVAACNVLVRGDGALRAVGLPPLGLPPLGALGAGIATSIGASVLAAVVLAAARRGPRPARAPAEDRVPVATIYRLGLPVGLQLLAQIGVFALVALLAGRLGARASSAHQIALGLASFSFMWALGVSGATAVRVGRAIGAGAPPRRAGVVGLFLGAGVMCVSAAAFALAPRPLIAAFTKDPEVIALGAELLRIAAIFQLFDGIQAVASGALRGAGDVRYPFYANVGAHWLLGLPLSLWLGFGVGLGARGFWIGLTAGIVTAAILLTIRFLRLSRRRIERI